MRYRRAMRWILLVVVVLTVATAVKAAFCSFRIRKPQDPPNSPLTNSAAEARRRGVWICDVAIEPPSSKLGDHEFQLVEAWIEAAGQEDVFLVWLPKFERADWNWLCLRIPRYEGGAIHIEPKGGRRAGTDFLDCWKLPLGEFQQKRIKVCFRELDKQKMQTMKPAEWVKEIKTHELGEVVLTPVGRIQKL